MPRSVEAPVNPLVPPARAANRPPRPDERSERFVPDLPERAAPRAKERAEARRNEPLPERGIRSDGKERPDAKGKPDAKAPDGDAAARKASPEAGRPQGEASGNAEADASGTPVDTAALVALQMETTGETPPAAGAVAVEAAPIAPALAAPAKDQPEPEGNGETGADAAAAPTVPVALPVLPVAAVPAEGDGETADDETSEEVSADAPSAPVVDALPDIRLQPAAPVAAPENAAADTTSTGGDTDVAISSGAGQRRGEGQPGPSPVALAAIEGAQGRAPEALAKAGPPQGETRPGETPQPQPQGQAATVGPDLSTSETKAEPTPTAQASQLSPSSPFDLRPAPPIGPQGLEAGARVGQTAHNQPPPQPAQTPAGQPFVQAGLGAVPIEIGMKAMAGVNRFQIRLDPPELGRVEVKLEVSDAGEVRASLVVDKVETLALLQRDAKTLERAFEQVGLKPSDQGIDLSLRDQSQRQNQNQPQDGERQGRRPDPRNEDAYGRTAEIAAENLPPARLWRGTAGGVDLRI